MSFAKVWLKRHNQNCETQNWLHECKTRDQERHKRHLQNQKTQNCMHEITIQSLTQMMDPPRVISPYFASIFWVLSFLSVSADIFLSVSADIFWVWALLLFSECESWYLWVWASWHSTLKNSKSTSWFHRAPSSCKRSPTGNWKLGKDKNYSISAGRLSVFPIELCRATKQEKPKTKC